MTLQSFIDKLFESIFTADNNLPPAVKYLYDLFDSSAFQHGLTDPDVVHSWKSNRSVSFTRLIEFLSDFCKFLYRDQVLHIMGGFRVGHTPTLRHSWGSQPASPLRRSALFECSRGVYPCYWDK